MSVHQLKDGRWVCRHPPGKDAERPTATARYFGRGDAGRAAAEAFNLQIGLGRDTVKTSSPFFAELVDSYLDAKEASLAETTKDRLIVRMDGIILPDFGNAMAHDINPARLDAYVARRRKNGVKNNSIHREICDIRAVLRWAVRRRLLAANPMDGFVMPTLDNQVIKPPSAAEFAAILKAAVPHLQRAMLISYYTGLRPGREELLSLTWDAVDWHEQTIMVTSAVKGGLPRRIVPLAKEMLDHLENWYRQDEQAGRLGRIVHYYGASVDSLKTAWKNAKARARITRRLRMYDIRHAFVTTLLERGADLKTVSELAGHASVDMTMRVYQHVNSEMKRSAISLISSVHDVPKKRTAKPRKH